MTRRDDQEIDMHGGITSTRRFLQMTQTALLAFADVTALYLAFIGAYQFRDADSRPFSVYIELSRFCQITLLMVPLWLVILAAAGLYSSRQTRSWAAVAARVCVAVTVAVMTLIAVEYVTATTTLFPSRSVPVIALVLGIVLVLLARAAVRLAFRILNSHGRALHRVIVVGAGPLAERICADLQRNNNVIVAVVSAGGEHSWVRGVPIFNDLRSALASSVGSVDEVLLADSTLHRSEVVNLMTIAGETKVSFRFVPDTYGVVASGSAMAMVAGVPVMEMRLTSLDGWAAVGKRLIDVFGAAFGIVVLAPVIAGVALAVKIADPAGPVFYRQTRLGRAGKPIKVWKFRSMSWRWSVGPDRNYQTAADAFVAMGRPELALEFEIDQKVDDDPRVFPVGRVLRRTSLDELPQLFNALVGDLSLVGPRPITPAELDRYGAHAASFLALKPGITGLWQVSGRSSVGYVERVQMDVFYVENWTPVMDVAILARTVLTVAARRGAV